MKHLSPISNILYHTYYLFHNTQYFSDRNRFWLFRRESTRRNRQLARYAMISWFKSWQLRRTRKTRYILHQLSNNGKLFLRIILTGFKIPPVGSTPTLLSKRNSSIVATISFGMGRARSFLIRRLGRRQTVIKSYNVVAQMLLLS